MRNSTYKRREQREKERGSAREREGLHAERETKTEKMQYSPSAVVKSMNQGERVPAVYNERTLGLVPILVKKCVSEHYQNGKRDIEREEGAGGRQRERETRKIY